MAGTQSITSQWVETGDLSKTNWLDVGKCSLLGGATGFVTGFVGAGAGGIITSKLTGAAVTAPLVNSSSTVTRVATHFAIGSVSEVTTGTISRFAGGMINTGDVGESLRQAFDPRSMLFDAALGGAVNSVQGINKPQQSFVDLMSPEDAARYNQYWDDVAHGIDTDTRVRLNQWDYRPDAELYLQYQDVYDNPKYYNQQNGEIQWPINSGFAGEPINEVLQPGTRIDRYGSDFGSFTSPEGTPYEARSVAPGTDQKPYSVFEVVKPIEVKSGVVAPWFNQQGGGIQYQLPKTVDELLDDEIIRRITQ